MRYLLDTNVLGAAMLGDARVDFRLEGLEELDVGLPQPVIAEVAAGIARLPKSKRRKSLRDSFEAAKRDFPRSAWTDEVSEAFGTLKAQLQARGRTIEDFDLAIAAHAIVEGATLVTANTRHFEHIPGLEVENWLDTH